MAKAGLTKTDNPPKVNVITDISVSRIRFAPRVLPKIMPDVFIDFIAGLFLL
jgi:hypothetical protein